MTRYLEKANYYSHTGKGVKSALLGALKISKVYGGYEVKPKYVSKKERKGKGYTKKLIKMEDKSFCLKVDLQKLKV